MAALRPFALEGDFGWLALEKIESGVTHQGEVEGSVAFGAALIFAEGDIELPVQIVLDAPMRAGGRKEDCRIGWQRGDVEPRLVRGGTRLLWVRTAVIAAMERKSGHSGCRSASQAASAARAVRSSIRP